MSGCGWPVLYNRCDGSTDAEFLGSVDSVVREQAEEMAIGLLDSWTGGMFGPCPTVVRPCKDAPETCRRDDFTTRGAWTFAPVLLEGRWYNLGCGRCSGSCSCAGPGSIALPGPVHEVTAVTVPGTVRPMPTDGYRVQGRMLVRTDGGVWPSWQDMSVPDDHADAFTVEYTRGLAVPMGGQVAAGVLALELMRAMCDDSECRLPERVQTITRQGVTVAMLDGFEGLDEGKTGIWVVDAWVASIRNPPRRSSVRSPDYRKVG